LLKKTPKINYDVVYAAVDDFALKKRHRYGTVLINAETGKVVDMIKSRETSEVAEWLKKFPNIQAFSRDGAGFYANAMRESHPEALQVMDRFHILQHLTDCCKKYINRTVKSSEPIETEEVSAEDIPVFKTTYEKIMTVKKMKNQGMSVTEISDALFIMTVTVRKYIKMSDEEAKKHDKKTELQKSDDACSAKEKTFYEVKQLYSDGYTKISIARKLGLSEATVKKYVDLKEPPVLAYNSQRNRMKIEPYMDKINELALKNIKPSVIFQELRSIGYTGSKAYLRKIISEQRKISFAPPKKKIKRKALISLLYKNLENISGLNEESLCCIIERYPKLSDIYFFVKSFKEMMFSKHYEQLEGWIENAQKSDIPEIHSFINGLKQDFNAVKAAIQYPYNNGVAEGTVTKIKLIKRTMFGRASFDLLKTKILLFS